MTTLTYLDFSVNQLNGVRPQSILNLSNLEVIDSSFNNHWELWRSCIWTFCFIARIIVIWKPTYWFTTWYYTTLSLRKLQVISSNQLSGYQLFNSLICASMTLLNISSNKFWGKFSGKFVHIQEIDLSSNSFEGPLPPIIAECSRINLSRNKFSGTLHSLSVAGDLSISFRDISHNQLFGALPDNWMHFRGLVFLNLGYNNFSGSTSTSMGNLYNLQTLILQNKKLCSELPASLRHCQCVGFVDVRLNKL